MSSNTIDDDNLSTDDLKEGVLYEAVCGYQVASSDGSQFIKLVESDNRQARVATFLFISRQVCCRSGSSRPHKLIHVVNLTTGSVETWFYSYGWFSNPPSRAWRIARVCDDG